MSGVATELPPAFTNFYTASTQVSAALIGLLFVSVSVGTESVFGAGAPLRRRLNAYGAFTALVNAFFLSFTSILPDPRIGVYAVILGAFALSDTYVNLMIVVRSRGERHTWAIVTTLLSALLYGAEVLLGALLLSHPGNDPGLLDNLNSLILAAYAFGLARAWTLLGGIGGHRLWRHLGHVVSERHEHAMNKDTHTEEAAPR